jgi:hypothetical protein
MEVDVKQECTGVNWKTVSETLKCVGMAYYEPDVHRRAFEASHTTVLVYHGDRLVGFGRALSIPRQGDRNDNHEDHLAPDLALQRHSIRVTRKRRVLPNTRIPEDENGHGALQERLSNERTWIHGMNGKISLFRSSSTGETHRDS